MCAIVSLQKLQLYAEESFTDDASEAVLHGKLALDLLRQIGVKIFLLRFLGVREREREKRNTKTYSSKK